MGTSAGCCAAAHRDNRFNGRKEAACKRSCSFLYCYAPAALKGLPARLLGPQPLIFQRLHQHACT